MGWMSIVALLTLVFSFAAAGPLLWSDDSAVLEWMPELLSGVRLFKITKEVAVTVLVAAGGSAGLLTETLRRWRRQGRLVRELSQLAARIVARLDVENEEDRKESEGEAVNVLEELISTALDAEDKAGSSPPRKKTKAASDE